MRRCVCWLVALLLSLSAMATQLEQDLAKATACLQNDNPEMAVALLTDLHSEYPNLSAITYNLALAEMQRYNYAEARRLLRRLFDNNAEQEFELIPYYLAQLELQTNNRVEALRLFRYFQNHCHNIDSKEYQLSKLGVASCQFATNDSAMTVELRILPNGAMSVYSPRYFDDDNLCYSYRIGQQPLQTICSQANPFAELLEYYADSLQVDITDFELSSNRQTIYYTRCHWGSSLDCDIWSTANEPKHQIAPRKLTEGGASQICLTSDSTALYVRHTTEGKDICIATIAQSGQLANSSPLPINTLGDEVSPYFDRQQQRLYFSSNGRIGCGGFDVYSVAFDGRQIIGSDAPQPELLLNSSFNDLYYVHNRRATKAVFVSNRKPCVIDSDSLWLNTLYESDLPTIDTNTNEQPIRQRYTIYFPQSQPEIILPDSESQLLLLQQQLDVSLVDTSLQSYKQMIRLLQKNAGKIISIELIGSYSTEGQLEQNTELARKRIELVSQAIGAAVDLSSCKMSKTILPDSEKTHLPIIRQRKVDVMIEIPKIGIMFE